MDPGYVAVHAEEDRRHWWFLGRQAIILAEMARWLPAGRLRLAELGCGSGGLLTGLARFGEVVGVEADPALREAARRRGLPVLSGTLPDDIPLAPGTLDAACLFDVLEHLDDDGRALARIRSLLAPGGLLFVTVPAYAWLWSRHDELLGHRRRYTARGLRLLAEHAGFHVERLTYFNTLLAPPILPLPLLPPPPPRPSPLPPRRPPRAPPPPSTRRSRRARRSSGAAGPRARSTGRADD